MKKLLVALAFVACVVPAKAEQTILTACTTPEAVESYTRRVYIDNEDASTVLAQLGDLCKLTFRVFEAGKPIKTFNDRKHDFTIVPITVQAEGTDAGGGMMTLTAKDETLYAMYYEKHDDGI